MASGSDENVGYDLLKFTGLTAIQKEELVCSICFGIFNKPKVTSCGCTFCNDCIRDWLTNGNNSCPLDREPLSVYDLRAAPRSLTNIINKLVMRCENETLGCKGFYLEDLPKHATNCKFHPQRRFAGNDLIKMANNPKFSYHKSTDINSMMKSLSITDSASKNFAPSAPPMPSSSNLPAPSAPSMPSPSSILPTPSAPPLSKLSPPSLMPPAQNLSADAVEIGRQAVVRFKPINDFFL
jgi:hypothetical protein